MMGLQDFGGRVAAAAVAVFLASDAASDLNGVILPVDDGWAAK